MPNDSPPMPGRDTKPPAIAALELLEEEQRCDRFVPYEDLAREFRVFLLVEGRRVGDFAIRSREFSNWLACFIYQKQRNLLSTGEINSIIAVLCGWAMDRQLPNTVDETILRVLKSTPLIAVLYEYMHRFPVDAREFSAEQLWRLLRDFAQERGLLSIGTKKFPGGANTFTRELRSFRIILAKLGIQFDIRRANGCKIILRVREDDLSDEPSTQPSDPNSTTARDLGHQDDCPTQTANQALLRGLENHRDNKDTNHREGER